MTLIELGWHPDFEQHFSSGPDNTRIPARVVRQDSQRYRLVSEPGEFTGIITGRMLHLSDSEEELPAVGDWVVIEPQSDGATAIILDVLPRRSAFKRTVPSSRKGAARAQVVAANIDTLFLVHGLDDNFRLRRIERYVTLAWESGATPVVVLNKADLREDIDEVLVEVAGVSPGVDVHAVSALDGDGIEPLRRYCTVGRTVGLTGSSGVGKSTLINALLGEARMRTTEVRTGDSRGRHTTTHRELVRLSDGGLLIDTPGMRELALWSDGEGVSATFSDIETLAEQCRFRDCRHDSEPGCAVKAALESGELSAARLESYRKQQREIAFLERRRDRSAALAEQAKWKKISKIVRRYYKER
ncbi:ribosome small subunit-dependent GTPase A [candidate division GN15 bacterium]|nr:ribosome small subunit-dependent GTPase A [candidate division GN15 bacterium]